MNALLRFLKIASVAVLMVVQPTAHAADGDTIQSHTTQVNGVRLHYLRVGDSGPLHAA